MKTIYIFLVTLILILNSCSPKVYKDLPREASLIKAQGLEYFKLLKANEETSRNVISSSSSVFSYRDNGVIKSIVFSNKEQIDRTITYNDSLKAVSIDSTARQSSEKEKIYMDIYYLMGETSKITNAATKYWAIVDEDANKFNAFMVPQQNDVHNLILGHDFLFEYNKNGGIIEPGNFDEFKFLHSNRILIPFKKPSGSSGTSLHTHSSSNSDFISPIDIAQILLCENKQEFTTHVVSSGRYVSSFDIRNRELTLEPKKDFVKRTGIKL